MKKKRKSRFFNDLRLRKCIFGFMLITLVVCSVEKTCADETVSGGGASGAVVTIRPNDAERLRELNRLREEAMLNAEKMKRLELELEASKEAAAKLEAELIELRTKLQAENERSRQLQLWLAGVRAEGTVRKAGEREEQMLQAIGKLSEDGVGLALEAVDFCDQVQTLLQELPIGKVRQAEYRLRLDGLARRARRFIAMADGPAEPRTGMDALRTCRILAVDSELSIVVLSVGSAKGVFTGMIYRVGKDRPIQLRVVAVRPYVAAAEVVKGSIGDLAPGMEAVAGETREAAAQGAAADSNKKQQE